MTYDDIIHLQFTFFVSFPYFSGAHCLLLITAETAETEVLQSLKAMRLTTQLSNAKQWEEKIKIIMKISLHISKRIMKTLLHIPNNPDQLEEKDEEKKT